MIYADIFVTNPTTKYILNLLAKGERVVRHGRKAFYSYVGGRQFPSKLVKEATQSMYEQRCDFRKVVSEACQMIDEEKPTEPTGEVATGNTGTQSNP